MKRYSEFAGGFVKRPNAVRDQLRVQVLIDEARRLHGPYRRLPETHPNPLRSSPVHNLYQQHVVALADYYRDIFTGHKPQRVSER